MFRAKISTSALAILLLNMATVSSAEPSDAAPQMRRAAVEKALPLLLKGAEGHVANRTCFACHNQGVPILAMTTARQRGFGVRDEDVRQQLEFIAAFLERNRDNYRQGKGQGGQVDTAGYALFSLDLGGWKPDATTEAVVEYLLQRDKNEEHWRTSSNRPPSEVSQFTTTYLSLRALRKWGTPAQQDRIAQRIVTVRGWLEKTQAKDTEDRVFRLLGLEAAGAMDKARQAAVEELVRSQREDGGWAQLNSMTSDAYAAGSVLVALHQAGGMSTSDPVYERGLEYLLKTQKDDGSWFVHSRSKPFQTYFESGFPHGKDQFISMAASGWATAALALSCPSE